MSDEYYLYEKSYFFQPNNIVKAIFYIPLEFHDIPDTLFVHDPDNIPILQTKIEYQIVELN